MIQQPTYHLKGAVLGGCNCEWGCPCNFEMPLSQGFGEGEYVGSLEQGKYEGVRLDGLNFGMFGHSPAAIHLGNLTTAVIVDVRANPEQKAALASMLTKVVPFGIFMDRTSNFLGIRYEE